MFGYNYMVISKHVFGSFVTASKFSLKVFGYWEGFYLSSMVLSFAGRYVAECKQSKIIA